MPTVSAEPTPRVFLDTNVVLYLLSADERKANTAEALLAQGGLLIEADDVGLAGHLRG